MIRDRIVQGRFAIYKLLVYTSAPPSVVMELMRQTLSARGGEVHNALAHAIVGNTKFTLCFSCPWLPHARTPTVTGRPLPSARGSNIPLRVGGKALAAVNMVLFT